MKKVVLITGASSGIGLAACKKFSENGWYVIGAARRPLNAKDPISRYICMDVTKPEDIEMLCQSIQSTEGQLDVLVNNAACQICKPLIETTPDEWDAIFSTNVRAPFLLTKRLYELLRAAKGMIINVALVHAVATSSNIAAYAASKSALVGLTRNMAIEFAKDGIMVNAILPGAVDTPMLRNGLKRGHVEGINEKDLVAKLGERHIIGRVGDPKEIAEVIFFWPIKTRHLLSPAKHWSLMEEQQRD